MRISKGSARIRIAGVMIGVVRRAGVSGVVRVRRKVAGDRGAMIGEIRAGEGPAPAGALENPEDSGDSGTSENFAGRGRSSRSFRKRRW